MNRFFEGYIEWLPSSKRKELPDDINDIDGDLWEAMMKAWLETTHPEELAEPLLIKATNNKSAADSLSAACEAAELADREDSLDGEEEEAEETRLDRNVEVVGMDRGEDNQDDRARYFGDLCVELTNAWLPTVDEYLDTLGPDLAGLNWKAEENLWHLPKKKKREIYRRWLLDSHHLSRDFLPELARLLERNAEQRDALERDRQRAFLQEMQVVGMTTTAVSKYQQLLKELRPEIVMVEEAAEVLESHILTALHPQTQHVILIGDHQQLRPSTAVYRLSKNFHLDVSLFERLIHNGASHVTLCQQRRMHPMVSRLIKPLYPDLRDHSSVSEYPEVMGVDSRVFFLAHNELEDGDGMSHSKSNTFELNFVCALAAHLVRSGYDESRITVLSPYLGQVRDIRNKMHSNPITENLQVTAVDNFQGEENDIILISLVRSNRQGQMGFLAVDNRINVALTRARHGMFIVGNADMLRKHTLWSQIIDSLAEKKSIGYRMPLLDIEVNSIVVEVQSAADINVLLNNECAEGQVYGGGRSGEVVHERWAWLGKEDPPVRDKDRARDRDWDDDRGGKSGDGKGDRDRNRDRDRGGMYGDGKGGRDKNWDRDWDDDRGGGGKGDQDRNRDRDWDRDRGKYGDGQGDRNRDRDWNRDRGGKCGDGKGWRDGYGNAATVVDERLPVGAIDFSSIADQLEKKDQRQAEAKRDDNASDSEAKGAQAKAGANGAGAGKKPNKKKNKVVLVSMGS